MKKKIIYLGIAFIMLFSLTGLSACGTFDLEQYKTEAKAELTTYADARCAELNCAEASAAIAGLLEQGKTAIDNAATKPAVNTARDAAKADINAVSQKEANGAFYSLQEAFDKGLLTKEDLQNIAYYHNDDSMPVYPETLNADVATAIKQDFVHNENCQDKGHDIEIIYYGTYNDSVAVLIYCQLYYDMKLYDETIEGIFFHYGSPNKIQIWVASQEEDFDMEQLELQIRQDYLRDLHANGETNFTLDDVEILRNYGLYGEACVVKMNRGAYLVVTQLTIDEVAFRFEDSNTPLVWVKGQFYELAEAYEQSLLSKVDLIEISSVQDDFLGV